MPLVRYSGANLDTILLTHYEPQHFYALTNGNTIPIVLCTTTFSHHRLPQAPIHVATRSAPCNINCGGPHLKVDPFARPVDKAQPDPRAPPPKSSAAEGRPSLRTKHKPKIHEPLDLLHRSPERLFPPVHRIYYSPLIQAPQIPPRHFDRQTDLEAGARVQREHFHRKKPYPNRSSDERTYQSRRRSTSSVHAS